MSLNTLVSFNSPLTDSNSLNYYFLPSPSVPIPDFPKLAPETLLLAYLLILYYFSSTSSVQPFLSHFFPFLSFMFLTWQLSLTYLLDQFLSSNHIHSHYLLNLFLSPHHLYSRYLLSKFLSSHHIHSCQNIYLPVQLLSYHHLHYIKNLSLFFLLYL